MKVNLRDSQTALWQELAELIGGKNPADAIAFIGALYLPAILEEIRKKPAPPPARSNLERVQPERLGAGLSDAKTEFDDLFDSIKNPESEAS
jgi:hypothetical protein